MTRARDIADSTKTLSVDGGTIKLDGNYPVGTENVALGEFTLRNLSTGGSNTAVGRGSLYSLTSAGSNSGFGTNSLVNNTTGATNTAIGASALHFNTTASNNTAVGYQAGYSNTTGGIVALGYQSLYSNTTGANNVGLGYAPLYNNSTGSQNTAIGFYALLNNTTANNNTAVGYRAAHQNTTGTVQAFGKEALYSNTTGLGNTAVGDNALKENTTASYSTAVGYLALVNSTGERNTSVGESSGYSLTTGSSNSFVGNSAGASITTGSKNTILGRYNGNQGGLDIRTSSNYIVLSDGDGNPRGIFDNNGYFGVGRDPGYQLDILNTRPDVVTARFEANYSSTTEYGIYINLASDPNDTSRYFIEGAGAGTSRFRVLSNGNVVNTNNSYGSLSDQKLKENIVDSGSQWDDIKALTVRKYSMKSDNLDAPNMLGVIAQEVEAAGMGGLVFESQDKDDDFNDLGTVTKQVNYSILYMKAVKALQEAMDRIETLEAKVTALENA